MNEDGATWIVSEIKWQIFRNGRKKVTHCNARSYRQLRSARTRFRAIVGSLEEQGFEFTELDIPPREEYEGVQGYCRGRVGEEYSSLHAVVFIDRNPR